MKMNPHRSVVTPSFRKVIDTEVWGQNGKFALSQMALGVHSSNAPSPFPRRKEDTCQSRMLNRLNRITPMESRQRVANPQGAVNSPAGVGSPKKRMPAAERQQVTGRIGHYPRRKPADVGLVDCP